MHKFTRYLDAWAFCRKHNLSMAAISRTGQWEFIVMVQDTYVVGH